MNWTELETLQQLETIADKSHQKPQLIFKHSRRCPISNVAKNRVEQSPKQPEADFYIVEVVSHRAISNEIEAKWKIQHESPQILFIKDGTCIYHKSHFDIDMEDLVTNV